MQNSKILLRCAALFAVISLCFFSCKAKPDNKDMNAIIAKLEAFKTKEKFLQDTNSHYPGIAYESMRPTFTSKINAAADDFIKVAQSENPTDEEYQKAIGIGLNRFSEVYLDLDTEDRERVCMYFEELMDVVGLESSVGQLNNFMYSFDPTKRID